VRRNSELGYNAEVPHQHRLLGLKSAPMGAAPSPMRAS